MKKAKFWLAAVLVIFMLVSIFGSGWWWSKKPAAPAAPVSAPATPTPIKSTIRFILEFSEEKRESYEIALADAATVFSALEQLAAANNFEVKTKESDFGVLVEAIDKVENSADQFWMYYVNGQLAPTAADQYQLKAGDLIEWKYEKLK